MLSGVSCPCAMMNDVGFPWSLFVHPGTSLCKCATCCSLVVRRFCRTLSFSSMNFALRPPEPPERPEPPAPPPPLRRPWSGTIPAHSRPPEPDRPPGQFHILDPRNRPWMHGWGMPAHGGFIPMNFGNDWDWRWRGDAFNEMEWQWNAWDSRWPQDSRTWQPDPDPSRGQPRREEGPTQQEMRLTRFMEKLDKDLKEGVQDLKHGDVETLAPVASFCRKQVFCFSSTRPWPIRKHEMSLIASIVELAGCFLVSSKLLQGHGVSNFRASSWRRLFGLGRDRGYTVP